MKSDAQVRGLVLAVAALSLIAIGIVNGQRWRISAGDLDFSLSEDGKIEGLRDRDHGPNGGKDLVGAIRHAPHNRLKTGTPGLCPRELGGLGTPDAGEVCTRNFLQFSDSSLKRIG